MPSDKVDDIGVVKKRIALEDLRKYAAGTAQVFEDVRAPNGTILLSRGMRLSSLGASIKSIEKKLYGWGISSLPIVIRNTFDLDDFKTALKNSKIGLSFSDSEGLRQTLGQLHTVFGHAAEGRCDAEDISRLVLRGEALAREASQVEQVMWCLEKVSGENDYLCVHSLNVALLSAFLAHRMFPEQPQLAEVLTVGGLLHDLGKARLSDFLLNKPTSLTNEEFSTVKKHSEYGEALAASGGISDPRVLAVIRGHHERLSGGGYPDTLNETEISQEMRIAAVADVFDALTTDRPHRNSVGGRNAVSVMVEDAGRSFDSKVMRTLLLSIGLYPPGSVVELSDDSIGIVVNVRDRDILRPQILLQIDETGRKVEDSRIVDLGSEKSLYIRNAVHDTGKMGTDF